MAAHGAGRTADPSGDCLLSRIRQRPVGVGEPNLTDRSDGRQRVGQPMTKGGILDSRHGPGDFNPAGFDCPPFGSAKG
jgi:hypothetical protein